MLVIITNCVYAIVSNKKTNNEYVYLVNIKLKT